MARKILKKLLWLLWNLLGLVPYLAITFVVTWLWLRTFGTGNVPTSPALPDLLKDAMTYEALLRDLSIIGGWAVWYLECKFVKAMFGHLMAYRR
ncbi:MAG: hypothetical protein PHQ43_04340 [Dehalococcoidales bacterium]|nr:hypothetical protein [Dehalococcoidales bacterium]